MIKVLNLTLICKCPVTEAVNELFLPKRCSFFPGATFFNNIDRIPTKFPGDLDTKRTAQVIQGDQKW